MSLRCWPRTVSISTASRPPTGSRPAPPRVGAVEASSLALREQQRSQMPVRAQLPSAPDPEFEMFGDVGKKIVRLVGIEIDCGSAESSHRLPR